MYQKCQTSPSGGLQNCETKNRRLGTIVTSFQDFKLREKQISPTFSYLLINNSLLYHFLANWLAHYKKMTEKSVFRETWSPEMTSQSFPVSWFGLAVLYPTGSEIWRSWYIKTRGRKIAIDFFLLYLSVHWGNLISRANKNRNLFYIQCCHLYWCGLVYQTAFFFKFKFYMSTL